MCGASTLAGFSFFQIQSKEYTYKKPTSVHVSIAINKSKVLLKDVSFMLTVPSAA